MLIGGLSPNRSVLRLAEHIKAYLSSSFLLLKIAHLFITQRASQIAPMVTSDNEPLSASIKNLQGKHFRHLTFFWTGGAVICAVRSELRPKSAPIYPRMFGVKTRSGLFSQDKGWRPCSLHPRYAGKVFRSTGKSLAYRNVNVKSASYWIRYNLNPPQTR